MMRVRIDLENHLSHRKFVNKKNHKSELARVISYLEKVPGHKIMGVVDWGDSRCKNLIESDLELSEKIDDNSVYISDAKTIIIRGEEVETDVGHMLAIGLPIFSYGFPREEVKGSEGLLKFGKICEDNGFIGIVGDCGEYGKLKDVLDGDLWKKFSGVKVWASEKDPRPGGWGQYNRASKFFDFMSYEFGNQAKGEMVTTDGHRMNMFNSCNLASVDWEKFMEGNVVENLKGVVGALKIVDSVRRKDRVGTAIHSLFAGWDNRLKEKSLGLFKPGDPFKQGYKPGKMEKWISDRGIGPFKV